MADTLTIVAIIAAYNEQDIVGQVVGHLIAQGVSVYLIDNGSTDQTVAEVEPFLNRGVIGIEHFVPPANPGAESPVPFDWTALLRRKEQLAQELRADWFIHHDADEFRESPWTHLDLARAIGFADGQGFNAVEFALLNFQATRDLEPGEDVREAFPFYQPARPWDRVQVKAWKRREAPVDLVSSGGHEAKFPGRHVFPLRFILRHYPIRGQRHGTRKVFEERLGRFTPEERAQGWHVQYDGLESGHDFLGASGEDLVRYDAEAVRLQLVLRHRGVEALEERLEQLRLRLEDAERVRDDRTHDVQRLLELLEGTRRAAEAAEAQGGLDREAVRSSIAEQCQAMLGMVNRLKQELEVCTSEVTQLTQALESATDREGPSP